MTIERVINCEWWILRAAFIQTYKNAPPYPERSTDQWIQHGWQTTRYETSGEQKEVGSIKMTAGSELRITAPLLGPYKGIALYQDRRAIDTMATGTGLSASSPNQITGNSETTIVGVIYIPSQQITVTGNGTMTAECMLMVVKRVVFNGTGSTMNLRKNCAGTGTSPFAASQVRLIS